MIYDGAIVLGEGDMPRGAGIDWRVTIGTDGELLTGYLVTGLGPYGGLMGGEAEIEMAEDALLLAQ